MPPRKYQCDQRWTGTVFLRKGASSSFQPKRSSSQRCTLPRRPMLGFLPASDKYLVTLDLYFKGFQRARWRAGDVASVHVIFAVVAGAPDFAGIVTVLHRAGQVRACGRHGLILAARGADQQSRTAAETKDLAAVRLQLACLGGNHGAAAHVRFLWRDKKPQHGIKECSRAQEKAAAQKRFHEPSTTDRRR